MWGISSAGRAVAAATGQQIAMYYVYVLRSLRNGRFYTGQTVDLDRRLQEHNAGKSAYDKINRPFEMIYHEVVADRQAAVARERYFKTGAGRDELHHTLTGH